MDHYIMQLPDYNSVLIESVGVRE